VYQVYGLTEEEIAIVEGGEGGDYRGWGKYTIRVRMLSFNSGVCGSRLASRRGGRSSTRWCIRSTG